MRAVVVGAGAAGTSAALALARGGADVTVVDGAAGATGMCSGAWEIAAVSSRSQMAAKSIAERIRAFADARPEHPYARIDGSVEAVERAHAAMFEALGGYRPLDVSGIGVRIATDCGVIRRVASHERSVLNLDETPDDLVAVADLRGQPRCDGAFLARSLSADPLAGNLVFVDVPLEFLSRRSDALMLSHEAAALGDAADARERLATVLSRGLPQAGPHAWLLPPLLGLDTDEGPDGVGQLLGCPAGEVAQAGAGPQAARLTRRLATARAEAEVTDARARAVDLRPSQVILSDERRLECDVVVLATGTPLAGGLTASDDALFEPLTGTRVPMGAFGSFDAPGDCFASGVPWDDSFRLLDTEGRPIRDGLFVCGSILDGVSHLDGTGLGASITTGWLAGEAALAG